MLKSILGYLSFGIWWVIYIYVTGGEGSSIVPDAFKKILVVFGFHFDFQDNEGLLTLEETESKFRDLPVEEPKLKFLLIDWVFYKLFELFQDFPNKF